LAGPSGATRRVFDCVLYDGEIDVVAVRLHELDAVVDWFVIVESTLTFSGLPRALSFNPGDPQIMRFAARFRHVIVADMPASDDPWQREISLRNAVLRGIPDAAPDDLVILSDVDEIPRAAVVREMVRDRDTDVFGLELGLFYFFVNYRNVEGPEAAVIGTVATPCRTLDAISPNDLRYAVRYRQVPARIIANAGWHFSYLMDKAQVRRKIAAFSHHEFNTPAFLDAINIDALVERRGDLFQRDGFVWALVDIADLPEWLQVNRQTLGQLFAPRASTPPRPVRAPAPPVVICPYLLDRESEEIHAKFALDSIQGAAIPFFLWQDRERVGPERAFELCWNRFPDHDIIIIHSDMAPFPGDDATLWYEALCDYRSRRADAGMIAANLFFPADGPDAPLRVQCAGGTFREETIGYIHGDVDGDDGVPLYLLEAVRPVDWVTFGGVLVRREVIRACGGFDKRYQWAYYMDCDYSFEARLRGFRLLQVPVRLQHEQSRSTGLMLTENPELAQCIEINRALFSEKWRPFLPAMPSQEMINSRP
jgi:hypothetical protein